jgi:hypothetical protein
MSVWERLLAGYPWHRGAGAYPIAAYSEFMPPPRLGWLPYGTYRATFDPAGDPWGWPVSEREEEFELRPALEHVPPEVIMRLVRLGRGEANHSTARASLEDNPYWPPRLAARAGRRSRRAIRNRRPSGRRPRR